MNVAPLFYCSLLLARSHLLFFLLVWLALRTCLFSGSGSLLGSAYSGVMAHSTTLSILYTWFIQSILLFRGYDSFVVYSFNVSDSFKTTAYSTWLIRSGVCIFPLDGSLESNVIQRAWFTLKNCIFRFNGSFFMFSIRLH